MLSISSGHSAEYLTGQVAQGRENYYIDATTTGEPPGRWWGTGAAAFGLEGEVDNDVMTALYTHFLDPRDPRFADPATRDQAARLGRAPGRYKTVEEVVGERLAQEPNALPERVREIRAEAERAERQPVMFVDATFSPVKSFTVLHTAVWRAEMDAQRAGDDSARAVWADMRADIEASLWAGNNTMLSVLSDRAGYSRAGRHGAGAGRWVDAHDWTVASFHQSDSRDHDPQQHVHNAILNRVVCADGEVRTLDSRAIHEWKQAAGGIGERAMEEELSRRLGVRWVMRPDGNGREIVGIDQQVMDLFSERSRNISKKLATEVDRFQERFGREPNALELTRLRQQSTLATRRAKTHAGETKEQQLDRWDAELRAEVVGGLRRVAEQVADSAGQAAEMTAEPFSPTGVIDEAIAACQDKRAAFSRSELERQITVRLPYLGGLSGEQVTDLVRGLADQAEGQLVPVSGQQPTGQVPTDLQLADGRSVYAAPGGRKFATHQHIVAEQALRRAAVERGALAVPLADVEKWMARADRPGSMLGDDQRAAVRGILTSGAKISVLIGPAGTGKSWTVGAMSTAWADLTGGRVYGLATSQRATEVLAGEGVTAKNTAQWVNAQERLAAGRPFGDDRRWQLRASDIVVVDEASMVDHGCLEQIRTYVERVGARILLTGDPRQLGAVGAGGSMEMLAEGVADTYHLSEVRRFAAEWERSASLRLRDGEREVLGEYDRHGRIYDCGTVEGAIHSAARGYIGDTLRGETSLVIAPTNQLAAQASAVIREQLVTLGKVEADGVLLGMDGNTAGVGDLVMARLNDYAIGVTNRQRYRVEEIHDDGSMSVRVEGGTDQRTLTPAYVDEHVVLGYAGTVHSVQGLTVTSGRAVDDGTMPLEAKYVGLSRGTRTNEIHVGTIRELPGETSGETHGRDRRTAMAVLGDAFDQEDATEKAAFVQGIENARQARSMHTVAAMLEDGVRDVTRLRLDQTLDHLAAEGVLAADDRQALAADQGTEQLSRLLRAVEQAGHDPGQALRDAIGERSLDGARSTAQVVHHRIAETYAGKMAPRVDDQAAAIPVGIPEDWRGYLSELGEVAVERCRELGTEVAGQALQWAVEALGPVPDDAVARLEWEAKAGTVAAYREATGWGNEAEPLGPAPGLSSTERRAAWHTAWSALGRPEATREEQDLSAGALRNRVQAWEREQAWQPKDVYEETRATAQALERHRQDAAILAARAETETDQVARVRLLEEAAEKEAMAARLADIEAGLAEVADQRGNWLAETAVTRELAERAEQELANRGRPIGAEDDRVTAAEWLAEHQAAMVVEDPHREVYETDVAEDLAEAEHVAEVGSNVSDDITPQQTDETTAEAEPETPAGVPSAAEVEAAAAAARLAAEEIAQREAAEKAKREAEAAQRAAEEDAAREAAYRAKQERLEAERAAEDEYEDVRG